MEPSTTTRVIDSAHEADLDNKDCWSGSFSNKISSAPRIHVLFPSKLNALHFRSDEKATTIFAVETLSEWTAAAKAVSGVLGKKFG